MGYKTYQIDQNMNSELNVKNLKEHDSVFIKNPTSEDFSWKFNGELYTVKAGEEKAFSKYVSFHLAKHLSTQMVVEEATSGAKKKELEDPKSPLHGKVSQLNIYDTPERRIVLHKILGNEELVVEVIKAYPFKGFVGDMDLYKKYLDELKAEKTPKKPVKKSDSGLE